MSELELQDSLNYYDRLGKEGTDIVVAPQKDKVKQEYKHRSTQGQDLYQNAPSERAKPIKVQGFGYIRQEDPMSRESHAARTSSPQERQKQWSNYDRHRW